MSRTSASCGSSCRTRPARSAGSTSRIALPASAARRPYSAGGLVADLPRPVHLVAEAPQPDVVRLRAAMTAPQVGPVRAAGQVAVLHQVGRGLDAPGAQVDRHHRRQAVALGPGQELVGADLVALDRPPREVEPTRAPIPGADAVLPPVARDEVATWVAHQGDTELVDQLRHVAAEAVRVRARMGRLVDAGVDAPAHVLNEAPEEPAVERPAGSSGVERDPCRAHAVPREKTASSKAAATSSSCRSVPCAPTICNPTGSPAGVRPNGTEIAGQPVTVIR